jgi:hypothetical protein
MLSLLVNAVVSAAVVCFTLARGGTVPLALVGLVSFTSSIWAVFYVRARALLLATGMAFAVMTIVVSPDVATEAVLSVAVSASVVAGISSNSRRVTIAR